MDRGGGTPVDGRRLACPRNRFQGLARVRRDAGFRSGVGGRCAPYPYDPPSYKSESLRASRFAAEVVSPYLWC
jgi:hypothetical protein